MKLDLNLLEPYLPVLQEHKRYYLICGGRSGGRSYFASQYASASLVSRSYFRCAIMRYVQGDIRNSIYQEIIDRFSEQGFYNREDGKDIIEAKEHTLTINFKLNTINGIGFRKSSSDQKAKLKSLAGYTDVIIEEAEEVSEEDFQQLDDSLRTIKAPIRVFLLFNLPSKNHWIVKRWFNLLPSGVDGFYMPVLKESEKENTCLIHTTYLDNIQNINSTTINNFENYKTRRPDHYYNMIKGLVSEGARGRIFKNWQIISDTEYDALEYEEKLGLDFGFTNDPTALIGVKRHNEKVYLREYIYRTGLTNKDISDEMENLGIDKNTFIYADSAEPKSIKELELLGWNIHPADKGADSVMAGIDIMLSLEISYTESSKNLDLEVQEFCWALDKNKEPINRPVDKNNHAMDASRYCITTSQNQAFIGVV